MREGNGGAEERLWNGSNDGGSNSSDGAIKAQ